MSEKEIVKNDAILVGIAERGNEVAECERSLDELERLLDTAGGRAVARVIQVKDSFDPRTCIGSGKVKEISEMCKNMELLCFVTRTNTVLVNYTSKTNRKIDQICV